jgi:hypothetical protein
MARALTMQRAMVPAAERAKYLATLRDRRAHYQNAECRFWVFEEAAVPGLFIEFTEAGDPDRLRAAHDKAATKPRDAARIYIEVEIP